MQLRYSGAKLWVRTFLYVLGLFAFAALQSAVTHEFESRPDRTVPFSAAFVDTLLPVTIMYLRDVVGWSGIDFDGLWRWIVACVAFLAFKLGWDWTMSQAFGVSGAHLSGPLFASIFLIMPFEKEPEHAPIEPEVAEAAKWDAMGGVLHDPVERGDKSG